MLGGDWTILHWPADRRLVRRGCAAITTWKTRRWRFTASAVIFRLRRTKFLVWTSGAGTDIYEPAANRSPSTSISTATSLTTYAPRQSCSNAEDRTWQPHPSHSQWLLKPLSGSAPGQPEAALVNIPAGSHATFHVSSPQSELKSWLFVISGDLAVTATGVRNSPEGIELQEGGFLAWSRVGRISSRSGPVSRGGCVALCVGHRLAGLHAPRSLSTDPTMSLRTLRLEPRTAESLPPLGRLG